MKPTLAILMVCASAFGANLLENSSFEAGDLRGWSYKAYGDPFAAPPEPLYFTNLFPYHGYKSFTMTTEGGKKNTLVSRLYRLTPGQQYTVSLYAKGQYSGSPFFASTILTVQNSRFGMDSYTTNYLPSSTNFERLGLTFTATNIEGQCTYIIQATCAGDSNPAGNFLHLDAFQLETGASATAYAPISPVEVGCLVDRATPAHVYHPDEASKVYLSAFNNTANASNVVVNWKLFDWWNSNKLSGTKTISAVANTSTVDSVTFTMTGKTNGWYRFLGWVSNSVDSQAEATLAILPAPIAISHRTNGMFGVESFPAAWYLAAEKRLGFNWTRNLSVFPWGRWNYAEPTLDTFVEWTNLVALNRTYDLEPLGQIGNGQGLTGIPAYAANPSEDGWPSNVLWSNFCFRVVSDYKPYVRYWEVWNENGWYSSGYYTNVLTYGGAAIRAADSDAVVVAPAEAYFLEVSNVVRVLGDNCLDIWSSHMYPQAELETATSSIGIDGTCRAMDHFSKAGWNTETGYRSDTAHELALWEENLFTPSLSPLGGGYARQRSFRVGGQIRNLYGTLVGPVDKYFYYDARNTGGHDGYIAFSIFDYDNNIGPMGAVVSSAINLREGGTSLGEFGVASLSSLVNAWTWTRSNQVYFALFPTNIYTTNVADTLTVSSSDGGTIIYDLLSNPQTGTVRFGREHVVVCGGVGVSSNTLAASLTIAAAADLTPPNFSFSTWPTATSPTRFTLRWTSMDDASLDTRDISNTSAIQYSYRLIGLDSDYSGFTNQSWVTYTTLNPSTEYTFTVIARDAAGNSVTNSIMFNQDDPPPPTPTPTWNTFNTLTVGTLNLGQ